MNKSFKVVFSKARSALMVVNEATSSVQAKGTKTVIAAAAAAMIAGGAMAEPGATTPTKTNVTNVNLVAGSSISLVVNDTSASGTKTTISGITVDTGTDEAQKNLAWDATKYNLTEAATVKATGGSFVVDATGYTGSTDLNMTKGAVTGTDAIFTVKANNKAAATFTGSAGITLDKAVIELSAHNGLGSAAAKGATVTARTITLYSGSLTTSATSTADADASGRGVAKLEASSGAMALGSAATYVAGTTVVDKPAQAFDITSDADTTVSASGALTYHAGTVKNSAKLTLTSSSAAAVTVAKDVAFAGNTGTIEITSTASGVDFNGVYDATGEGFTGGNLNVSGTNVAINGTIKADTVLIGTPVAGKDTNSVVINSTTNKVDGTLNATGTLTLNTSFSTSGGSVTAAATKVNASGVAVTIDSKTVDQKTVNPTVDFGALTVVAAATATANNLTITNNVENVGVVATTITIEPTTTAPNATAGSLTLAKGTMVADALTVGASGTLTVSSGSAAALTLNKGESNNAGTITLGTSGTLTVAKDAVLTNAAGGKIGADTTPAGTLNVAGTVKNPWSKDSNGRLQTGTLQAAELNIAKGGIVESLLADDAYKVTTTNIGEGTFKTELNRRVDDAAATTDKPYDALELKTAFSVDGGSFVTGTDNKEVTNFVLNGASGALTVGADKALATVKAVSGGQFNVEDAAVSVKDLNLESGTATVTNGNLAVEQLRTTAASTVQAQDGSTVTASLAALGLGVSGSAFTEAKYHATTAPSNGNVVANSVSLDQGSVLKITGIADGTEFTVAGLSGAKALVSGAGTAGSGLIDLGNIKVSGYDTSKVIDVSSNELAGITYKDLQAATVKASGFTTSAIYGKVQSSGASITIGNKATLELTGSDGKLISYESGSGNWVNTAVTLGSGGELIATGTNGSVGSVTGNSGTFGVAKGGSVIVEGNVDVGELFIDQASTMTVQTVAAGKTPYTVKTGLFQADGTFTAKDATVELTNAKNTAAEVDTIAKGGVVTVAGLKKTAGKLDVLGSLTVTGKIEGSGSTINVGNATTAGTLVAGELVSGSKVFADPAWVDGKAQETSIVAVKTLAAGATVEGGRNSIIALGTTNAAEAVNAVAATGFTLAETDAAKKIYSADTKTVNSVLYVNGGKTAETQAAMIKGVTAVHGADKAANPAISGVNVATNSMLAIDATTVDTTGTTAVFAQAMTLEDNSVVYLANAAAGQTIKLSGTSVKDRGADLFYHGDLLMDANIDDATNNLTVTMIGAADREVLGNLPGMKAAMAMYETGANIGNTSKSALFNDWLYTSSNHASINEVRTAAKDVASLGATTGVQTMTMDAVNQMGETVADRVSLLTQRAAGVNVWAAANGGMFEAKSLFDGAGYESDIYSGVLGVDYQFACNAVLGAALTIGTADTDNKNSTVKASTDSDLVGFSVYASKTFADVLGVSADIGYLTASNDVTANGYGQAWKFSQDTDAFTIGLRAEVLAEVGAVKLVPHIGIRYTALSTDGFEAGYKTEIDDQNVFQMPVGVTVSGDFQTGDWTVAPKFDLSVVPTFGDKDADLKLGITGVNATDDLAVRVIDSNPVQATLGVNATNGAWGFGLNYKLGVGSDDRMNNTFNVNVRYAF